MSTTHKSKRSQTLSGNENSNEKLADDEQKKERRKNRKERDDKYL
jgi:hypothetical protein